MKSRQRSRNKPKRSLPSKGVSENKNTHLEVKVEQPPDLGVTTTDKEAWGELDPLTQPYSLTVYQSNPKEYKEYKKKMDRCTDMITQQLMVEPVAGAGKARYEKEMYRRLTQDPQTKQPIDPTRLEVDLWVQEFIHDFLQEYPLVYFSAERYQPQSWRDQLETAVKTADLRKLRDLHRLDPRLFLQPLKNTEDKIQYPTIMHLACAYGRVEVIDQVNQLLTEREAKWDLCYQQDPAFQMTHPRLPLWMMLKKDEAGYLPIHWAVKSENSASVLLHISHLMGRYLEEVEAKKPEADTELLFTTSTKKVHVPLDEALWQSVKEDSRLKTACFLRLGARPNYPETGGQPSLLITALTGRHLDCAELLLQHHASVEAETGEGETVLFDSIRRGELNAVKLLLNFKASISHCNQNGQTILHLLALSSADPEPILQLFKSDDETSLKESVHIVDEQGNTPLHLSVGNHLNMTEFLLARGATVNVANHRGNTPLHTAVQGALSAQVIALLIQHKAQLLANQKLQTPLHFAAQCLSTEKMTALQPLMVEKEEKKEEGSHTTPAAIEAEDWLGNTPLYYAVKKGLSDHVNGLLIQGATIDRVNKVGETIIHCAAFYGQAALIDRILDRVDSLSILSVQDKAGSTALHSAVLGGSLEVIALLLRVGCSPDIQDHQRLTPLKLARSMDKETLVNAFEALIKKRVAEEQKALKKALAGDSIFASLLFQSQQIMTHQQAQISELSASLRQKDHELDEALSSLPIRQKNLSLQASLEAQQALELAVTSRDILAVRSMLSMGAKPTLGMFREALEEKSSRLFILLYRVLSELNPIHYHADDSGSEADFPAWVALQARWSRRDKATVLDLLEESGSELNSDCFAATFGDISELMLTPQDESYEEDEEGNSVSHYAASNDHLVLVKWLLENERAGLEDTNDVGQTILWFAVAMGHITLVKFLLEAGASLAVISEKPFYSGTPLSVAAKRGDEEMVSLLLEHDPNLMDEENEDDETALIDNETALMMAASSGHAAVVSILLAYGANATLRRSDGQTALHLAAAQKSGRVVTLLANAHPDIDIVDKDQQTPLHRAARSGRINIMNTLLEKNASLLAEDKSGFTVLGCAIQAGHLPVVEYLVEKKADLSKAKVLWRELYTSAITLAIENKQESIVRLLLKQGIAATSKSLLYQAAEAGSLPIVQLLLASGASCEDEDYLHQRALCVAAEDGHQDIVQHLLAVKAVVDTVADNKVTPLMAASRKGHVVCLQHLLEAKAQINRKDEEEMTALHHAAHQGHGAVVEKLVASGASVGDLNKKGETAFFLAAQAGHEAVIRILLNRGTAEQSNKRGWTPRMIAAIHGHEAVVKLLEEQKLSVSLSQAIIVDVAQGDLASFQKHSEEYDRSQRWYPVATPITAKSITAKSITDSSRRTLLHITIEYDRLNMVTYLLGYGVDVNAKDQAGYTALSLAVQKNREAMIPLLINAPKIELDSADGLSVTPLHFSASRNYPPILHALIEAKASINTVDSEGWSPLMDAIHQQDHTECACILIRAKATVNVRSLREWSQIAPGSTALWLAAKKGNTVLIQALLAAKATADMSNAEGDTPLHMAVSSGKITAVRALLDPKISGMNHKNSKGETPLALAKKESYGSDADSHRMDILQCLLEQKDIQVGSRAEWTPGLFRSAAAHLNAVAFQRLLDLGMAIDEVGTIGQTALMSAVQAKNFAVVKKLIAANAHINLTESDGWSALMFAVRARSPEMVQVLLEAKADTSICSTKAWGADPAGSTALSMATKNKDAAIIELLSPSLHTALAL